MGMSSVLGRMWWRAAKASISRMVVRLPVALPRIARSPSMRLVTGTLTSPGGTPTTMRDHVHVGGPIDLGRGGRKEQVARVFGAFELVGMRREDEVVRAETVGFEFLMGRSGECDDVGAHGACELDREVAEPADADDADGIARAEVTPQGGEDGVSGAQERRSGLGGECVGQGIGEAAVDVDVVGESAVAADAGGGLGWATGFFALDAPFAGHATGALPPNADAPAQFEAGHAGTNGRNGSDDLMSGDQRELGDAPIVVEKMQVAVAHAAVRDGHLDLERL